jgi:type II secretion system (T2SS) protein K
MTRPDQRRPGGRKRERGMALLMVIWMVVLLSAIAAEYSLNMRTDLLITDSVKDEAEAYYMAVAGFNAATSELMQRIGTQFLDSNGQVAFSPVALTADSTGEGVIQPPVQRSMSLDTGSFAYQINDEQGKFSVRTPTVGPITQTGMTWGDAFKEILRASGVSDEVQLATIVDSAIDWVDRGDEHQLNGAEDDWYESHYREQGMDHPYKTPDAGRLWTVEELLLIRGMTPEILYGSAAVHSATLVGGSGQESAAAASGPYLGIFDHISVYSRGNPSNLLTADPAVVAIFQPERYDEIQNQRQSGLPLPDASSPSSTFSIVSTGWSRSGQTHHSIRAVVQRIDRGPANGVMIRIPEWDDNDLHDTLSAPSEPQ